MIARYTRPDIGRVFSDENRFTQWLAVELAASEALAELGQVPAPAASALRAYAAFDVQRIHEIEREVKHDVIAFTTAVAERMAAAGQADASRWLHYGLTSNDVVDTAQALVLAEALTKPVTHSMKLEAQGISCEIVDVQTLLPFDIHHKILTFLLVPIKFCQIIIRRSRPHSSFREYFNHFS
jgi:adenylosuccinate lyase